MSDSLEIHDIQTLSDLHAALGRFSTDVQQGLRVAEGSIRETLEWLEGRIRHWQREVERAHQMVQQAQADLSRCQASGYVDRDGHYHQPDCSRQRAALQAAQEHLRLCQENLQTAQTWRSKVNGAVDAYHREARRLEQTARHHTERAQAELTSLRGTYETVHQHGAELMASGGVDLVVIDEAHRLRNCGERARSLASVPAASPSRRCGRCCQCT